MEKEDASSVSSCSNTEWLETLALTPAPCCPAMMALGSLDDKPGPGQPRAYQDGDRPSAPTGLNLSSQKYSCQFTEAPTQTVFDDLVSTPQNNNPRGGTTLRDACEAVGEGGDIPLNGPSHPEAGSREFTCERLSRPQSGWVSTPSRGNGRGGCGRSHPSQGALPATACF